MARLFGVNKLRERAQEIPTSQIEEHLIRVQTWREDYHTGTLRTDRETSREQAYNQDFFIRTLGYKEKPSSPHTFVPKATTDKRQLPDAVICFANNVQKDPIIFAVVELKGASVPLDRPQQREGNLSPVAQGFKYKSQYRSCPFVVVSNFYEFRLYNDNQLDYESWTLDDLVDPTDDYLKFKTWYVLMHADNMVATTGKSQTELLLSTIRQKQEDIGTEFYIKYRSARKELLQDIWAKNPKTRFQFDIAIQKAQTIIDRIIFACFAEDRGLLPDDIVALTLKYADEDPYEGSLFEHLKRLFASIDRGSARMQVPAYNGGLFASDPWIDALDISDTPLRRFMKLGKYDFDKDLSVNILGHIFEQSITDLEEIRRQISNDADGFAEPVTEPKVGRRKKDGIFYTSDYIVRHIVDATLGEYLRKKEAEALARQNMTGRLGEAGYERREQAAYLDYQHTLQTVRVLDPACGSGAFLVYVFDYLLLENRRVDVILGGNLTSQDAFVRSILRDNIFGVDINEESVEITKLSLWLNTAEKGKALTTLDANIRHGNSLVEDAEIDPEAFPWETNFPDVLTGPNKGFDVIVGNPPYVQLSRITDVSEELRTYLLNTYETSGGRLNTYIFFILLGMRLLRPGGRLGYIVPNTLPTQPGYKDARKLILDGADISEIVEYPDMPFQDATVENITLVLEKPLDLKARPETRPFSLREQTAESMLIKSTLDQVPYLTSKNFIWSLRGDEVTDHIDALSDTFEMSQYFNINQAIALRGDRSLSIHAAPNGDNYYKLLDGRNVTKYQVDWTGAWFEYVLERIHSCKRKDIFEAEEKLLFRRTGTSLIAAYDNEQYFALNTLVVVTLKRGLEAPLSLKALLAVFNSLTLNHYYSRKYKSSKTVFSEIQARTIGNLPIPRSVTEHDAALSELADQLISLHSSLKADINSATDYICKVHEVDHLVITNAVLASDWPAVEEVFKHLPIKTRREVFDYLVQVSKDQEQKLVSIEAANKRIERLVADIYGLTGEMRSIVEKPL